MAILAISASGSALSRVFGSPQDRVYIDAVGETIAQFRISDRTWEALVGMHPLETVEEVLLLIGTYLSLATFLNSAEVPLDDVALDREWPPPADSQAAALAPCPRP